MLVNTDEEVAEQIPNLNIVKTNKRETCFLILELILLFATLAVLVIAAVALLRESLWIK